MSSLKYGWSLSIIGKLASYVQRGKSPKYTEYSELPVINQKCIRWNKLETQHLKYIHPEQIAAWDSTRYISPGDILWNSTGTGTVGRAYLVTETDCTTPKVVDSHVTIVRSCNEVDPRYLFNWIKGPLVQQKIEEMCDGTTNQIELSRQAITATEIPIAPLNEQKRIADKLDSLLARVNACRDRLDRIPSILKRFRQSVLVDAVTGKLTAEYRKSSEYSDTDLGWELPDCWDLLTISDVAEVKGGKRLPKGKLLVSRNTGFPYIRAGQLKDGTVIPDEQLYLEADVQSQIARYIVKCGDVYITIVGACIGDAGVIPPSYDGANLTENAAKLCDFKKAVSSQFLAFGLRSQLLQDIIQKEIKSGAQGKLALMRIKTLPLPYPSIDEQTEIVRRVESLFAYADRLEARYKTARAQVEKLTPALLAKAFRGELVPQDPNDEPASGLLERIAAVKPSHTKKKSTRKQS